MEIGDLLTSRQRMACEEETKGAGYFLLDEIWIALGKSSPRPKSGSTAAKFRKKGVKDGISEVVVCFLRSENWDVWCLHFSSRGLSAASDGGATDNVCKIAMVNVHHLPDAAAHLLHCRATTTEEVYLTNKLIEERKAFDEARLWTGISFFRKLDHWLSFPSSPSLPLSLMDFLNFIGKICETYNFILPSVR